MCSGFYLSQPCIVHGLNKATQYNDKIAKILQIPSQNQPRYAVAFEDGHQVKIQAQNLRPVDLKRALIAYSGGEDEPKLLLSEKSGGEYTIKIEEIKKHAIFLDPEYYYTLSKTQQTSKPAFK